MRNFKIIYVAGPYTTDTTIGKLINVAKAEELAKQLTILGYVTIIPHKNTSLWDEDSKFIEWDARKWLEDYCFELLKISDAMILTDGWQNSKGCLAEIEFVKKNNIPYFTTVSNLLRGFNKII